MNTEISQESHFADDGKYSHRFVIVVALFVTCLITANIVSVKLIKLFGWVLPAGVLIFPISYIVGDVLTEVYGYGAARRVIWLGFLCNLIVVFVIWLGKILPPASFWEGQAAYDRILGFTPRLLVASFLAYLFGEFFNAFIMAKMKIATKGRWLWSRTIGSTLVGEGLDSFLFITLAFGGVIPVDDLAFTIITQWVVKSAYEAAATPLTYFSVRTLKQRERLDAYDYTTRFNPLLFKR